MNSLKQEEVNDGGRRVPLLDNDDGNDNNTYQTQSSSGSYCITTRYVVAVWVFFGFFCLYSLRINLSVGIVAMTLPQSVTNESIQACPFTDNNNSNNNNSSSQMISIEGKLDWSPKTQGYVLSSFFYGYLLTQIIGGNLAEQFGAKWIFGGSILGAGILTLLIPLAARIHAGVLIAIQILNGAFQGPAFPSIAALWGRWIPPFERSIVPPAASAGKEFGVAIITPLVSLLCASTFLGGWPSAFYVTGLFACVWFIGWCFFAYNSPSEHPRIAFEEKTFLLQCVPKPKKIRTPWFHIATCIPLYGIAINHICYNFVYYILLTSLPTYFSTILRFDLRRNGLVSAIPFMFHLLFAIVSGQIADRVRRKRILSTTVTRKLQTIIGACGTSVFLVLVGYIGCNHTLAVVSIILAIAFMGFQNSGSIISYLDIANNYAGTLCGITNTLATIPGFVGPTFVGWITNKNQTIKAWRIIFNVSSGIGLVGCLVYCLLFNGEEQEWNRLNQTQATKSAHKRTKKQISAA
ncbi:unnamed protein product [Rotaria sordida]|uniref:Major facilitator superfamily (MFS) profile domain-containing protein n=1 Tax=Rotaria sordida TaxID=392033 RepID=A0A815A930_9BILA|nr:unnamed protein product [Rotaria sordida]CAF1253925.1 unnamed protein product [Rotaria sordida]